MKASNLTKETILDYGITDKKLPDFRVGDTIEVALLVKDGEKQRTQFFKGDVIAAHNKGIGSTFTVRKIGANSIGVEKIIPYHATILEGVKVIKKGVVRRAKLNYIRERVGKAARVKEKILTKQQLQGQIKQATAPVEKPAPVVKKAAPAKPATDVEKKETKK